MLMKREQDDKAFCSRLSTSLRPSRVRTKQGINELFDYFKLSEIAMKHKKR